MSFQKNERSLLVNDEKFYLLDQKRRLEVVFHGTRNEVVEVLNSLDKNILKTYHFPMLIKRGIVIKVNGMELIVVEDFDTE